MPESRQQSRIALAIISGPLSMRMCSGAPRLAYHVVGGDGATKLAAEALAGVLVAYRQRLDRSPVGGRIEYEIEAWTVSPSLASISVRTQS